MPSEQNDTGINVTKDDQQIVNKKWNIKSSCFAKNSLNVIRNIVDNLKIEPNPEKPMIPLSIGDPTTFGNLKTSDAVTKAIKRAIDDSKCFGYAHTVGHEDARKAVAKYCAHQGNVSAKDVILTSGCSTALDMVISVLAERGQNILTPSPGFPLYETIAYGMGIETRSYNLIPEKNWNVDLTQMENLIDENTAAILINNPNNPCGSVFSKEHLNDIIAIAERNCIPIIADEIYEHFVFRGTKYHAISSLSRNVPVLSLGGLTKRFLVPGWRMGWIVIHNRNGYLDDIFGGLVNIAGRCMGSSTIIQRALPEILERTPQKFFDDTLDVIHKNAITAYEILKNVRGLKPIMPSGAMYMMIGLDMEKFSEFSSDLHFVQTLVQEQSVFCLPGGSFKAPNFVRIVLTVPGDMLKEACNRIVEFCEKHYKRDVRIINETLFDKNIYK